MKALIIFLAMTLSACNGAVDVSKVKQGMNEAQVTKTIGDPSEKIDVPPKTFGVSWWKYGKSIVVFQRGIVVNTVVDASIVEAQMQALSKEMKEIK